MERQMCALLLVIIMINVIQSDNEQPIQDFTETNVGVREYCLAKEPFEARCLKNEVILMNSAIYGRMRIGRCLEDKEHQLLEAAFRNDPQVFGCSVDVIGILDQKCSGRSQCVLRGTDNDLQNESPCYKVLKSYLEANYECVTVIDEDQSCHISVSSNPLHIVRSSAAKQSCGTKSQPWILEAPTGQQVSITLIDFGLKTKSSNEPHEPACHPYGSLRDKSAKLNTSICGLGPERIQFVYKSLSNVVEVILNGTVSENEQKPSFLLRFIAVGCSDIVPPDDAWLRRTDNEAVVGCYTTRRTWALRCTDNHWVGVMGNCSAEFSEQDVDIVQPENKSQIVSQQGMVLVVIICFGVAICLVIVCVGIVCWRRYNSEYLRKIARLEENCKHHPVNYAS